MQPPAAHAALLTGCPRLSHGFFGRRGGISTGDYESLNAGEGSADDPQAVAQNRSRIAAAIGAEHLVSCYQVHSPYVVRVAAPWTHRPEADAMVTDRPGIGLCVLSADCTPVLFADPDAGIIGAAHAGWRGALAGVLQRTLEAMEGLGAARGRIRAVIGPTIGPDSYEVGPEFRNTFLAEDAASSELFRQGRDDRFYFDLPEFCRRQLVAAGTGAVSDLGLDTCALEETYFSNRRRNLRGEADYGRNASAIVILS